MLTLYNSRTLHKHPFIPLNPQHVAMYVCGPTVYDRIHLGNARSAVVFDGIYRLLQHLFPRVTYVRNITDVDDKINAAAMQKAIPITELTEKTIAYFHQDIACLNVLPPTIEPRATDHIADMIAMIETLIAQGAAYVHEGHVLFDITAFPTYGHLSHMQWEHMKVGARVEVAPYKRNPVDFVLWKPDDEVGWDSPWGYGRPGWHIECSAMSTRFLGPRFDIHGGGSDLLFPHHENERAQSCASSGQPENATYWLHNGMLVVEGQKMSKSLGNFITLQAALQDHRGEVIRWALLSSHYRHPLDWTPRLLHQASRCLQQLYQSLAATPSMEDLTEVDDEIKSALCEDFNTPEALTLLQHKAQKLLKGGTTTQGAILKKTAQLLGFATLSPEQWFKATQGLQIDTTTIEDCIEKRRQARQQGNYAESDRLRQWLEDQGIILEDHPGNQTTWKVRGS